MPCGESVKAVAYGRALRAIKGLVAKSGHDPDEFALQVMRIGGVTTLAAGGGISERVIQREARWKPDAHKANTRNKHREDSRRVSGKVVVVSEGKECKPGERTAWGRK